MKKIFLFAATAATVLSSCSKNDISEISTPNDNPNAIGLNIGAFATKSEVTDATTLEDAGVTLYSTDTKFGELAFSYDPTAKWTNDEDQTWEGITFDMSVYSAHDGANVPLTIPTSPAAAAGDAISFEYDAMDGDKDLVYFGKTLSTIPSGAMISATYKHALSRVKMENITDAKMTADVIDVELMGFYGDGAAAINPTSNTITWDVENATDADYDYDLANAATLSNDMYIIPKKTAAFVADATTKKLVAPYDGKSAVTALCITSIGDEPIVGYEDVAAFKAANPDVTSVKVKSTGAVYEGKMYVKAIFPMNEVELVDGIYYNLQLNFAGTSVYYFDDNYYTEDGEEIEIDGETTPPGPEEGKPINPSDTDLIGLSVVVTPWPATATPVEL